MEKLKQILLENHLAFLATHRGQVRNEGHALFVESDKPEFTYAILGSSSTRANLPSSVKMVQRLPWSQISEGDLIEAGFVAAINYSYMILGEPFSKWRNHDDLSIERVVDVAHMEAFSEVQSRGFIESQNEYDSWHPWLRAANHRNLKNPNQSFYIGRLGSQAVGVVLTVIEGESAGICAVATLPAFRKSGISTTIMEKAILDARAQGCKIITLQVRQDSYVEDFYRHLGFQRIFTTTLYKRN
ncbi:MAG: GNAT family N-acetyltransferase [Bdellovibrionaceae bacterium]|nr:GNAT family N-acetyltransferase [Pseudobdellovibrionaceae bacterium]